MCVCVKKYTLPISSETFKFFFLNSIRRSLTFRVHILFIYYATPTLKLHMLYNIRTFRLHSASGNVSFSNLQTRKVHNYKLEVGSRTFRTPHPHTRKLKEI